MAPISEARKRANDEYLKTQDEIKVRVPKGKKLKSNPMPINTIMEV